MNKICINGKAITTNNCSSISVINDKVIINRKVIETLENYQEHNIEIIISGNCENIDTTGNVTIQGNCGNIDCNGNVICYGDIQGDIDCNGNVSLKRK